MNPTRCAPIPRSFVNEHKLVKIGQKPSDGVPIGIAADSIALEGDGGDALIGVVEPSESSMQRWNRYELPPRLVQLSLDLIKVCCWSPFDEWKNKLGVDSIQSTRATPPTNMRITRNAILPEVGEMGVDKGFLDTKGFTDVWNTVSKLEHARDAVLEVLVNGTTGHGGGWSIEVERATRREAPALWE
jgi:hypothetical protein